MPAILFENVIRRAKENCAKDGNKWEVEMRPQGKLASSRTPSISENMKRSYIVNAERELKLERTKRIPFSPKSKKTVLVPKD